MRLPVSAARLIERRSDETDTTDLANEIRDRVINQEARYWQTATTTSATALTIWTDSLPANAGALVRAEFVGVTAAGAQVGSYMRRATFRRPGTAAVVLVGAPSTLGTDDEDVAGWDVGVGVNPAATGSIYAFVQGAAGQTVFWRAHVEVLVSPWR